MADINDFKTINIKSRKMFDFLEVPDEESLGEIQKSRLGFYHLILENVTGLKEIEEIKDIIIDSEYNKIVNGIGIDDLGMDAVYINYDKEEKDIYLFNFKYREKFNPDKTKDEMDIGASIKFLQYLVTERLSSKINSKVKDKIKKIRALLSSNNICNLVLYMVSNEAKGYNITTNEYLKMLEESYGMKIINLSLDEIIGFFSELKTDQKCKFMISRDDCFPFDADEKSTKKSYIIKMPLVDLIRITSSNFLLANKYNSENDQEIDGCTLDLSVLYDNVRGYLGNTKYNKNIYDTLENSHKNFFLYNNGITLTAKNIESEEKNSGKKYLFTVDNFQVVNGGQTLRSIYNFLNNYKLSNKYSILREAFILVRIFKINEDNALKNCIAEYTNSQNAISPIDLKSVDNIQIKIENYLKEAGILYVRKAGNTGAISFDYSFRISMERLAKIIYSIKGFPDKAINQKKRLFIDYYEDIFKNNGFNVDVALSLTRIYSSIEKYYKTKRKTYLYSEQKAIYVIYMMKKTKCKGEEAIDKLEHVIKSFKSKSKKELSEARKLILREFKDYLDSTL